MEFIVPVLFLIAIFGFLVGGYFTFKLALETKSEKYWYFFAVSAFAMALHQIVEFIGYIGIIKVEYGLLMSLILHIISGLSIAYASYGILKTMIKIREKVE